MKETIRIINEAARLHPRLAICFSGGRDSSVLLDLVYTRTEHKPVVIFANSGMEFPETIAFVKARCEHYNAHLLVATAPRTPLEQWHKSGWPALGKLSARIYMQRHHGCGFKVDVSSCCRQMKILPARKLCRSYGIDCQLTGQRGQVDDRLRGMRVALDGCSHYVKADRMTIVNPLTGWTDTMIQRYITQNAIPLHPLIERGAQTIGCMYCAGGAQFDNSGIRHLREMDPDAWHRFIVDWKAGEIIMAIKYESDLATTQAAIERMGGLEHLATTKPWLFDYLRINPLAGYSK